MQEKNSYFEHERLLFNRNVALSNLTNTFSEKQFSLFKKYLQQEEKLKKYETINLINSILNTKKH